MKLFNSSPINLVKLLINITLIIRVLDLNKKTRFIKTSLMASFLFVKNISNFNSKPHFQLSL
jgi:hypothetical protein